MEQVLMHDVQRWVAPQQAWLVARAGSVWVTRRGDPNDHVLARGERLAVVRGDEVVIEALHRGMPAVWDWQPRVVPAGYRLRRELPVWVWTGTARALRRAADTLEGLATLARSAAARACLAQGCISPGDSIASGGALQ